LGPLHITTVEGLAHCGWQTFVRRLLRLEVLPDPLQALPDSNPRLVGSTVHAVLEGLVLDQLGDTPIDLATGHWPAPVDIVWPSESELAERLAAAARTVLKQEGIGLPGLERVLEVQARSFLDRARELDWADGGRLQGVVGAEVEGACEVVDSGGERREIRFRADRVDLVDGKSLRLTDYKTGRPISIAKGESTRARHFLHGVAAGRFLQAVAYRMAGGGEGRFLFLGDDLEPDAVEFKATGEDAMLSAAFERSTRSVLDAWEAGVFAPRLVDYGLEKEFAGCSRCEVSQACLQQDSGARARLVRWIEARDARRRRFPGEDEMLAWWDLQAKFDPAVLERGASDS
jgi:RecB family exonuclease